eukprot:TRINITY_DN34968_c0_g1_i1.p3 TRINITY_DN34968_c0_g1~~TRINITY_DN34968_c0_g1_i1.p3  ORF type:complete len:108 (-),score=29.92 TRINITY_DN34968_c0_g1_i1:136-459(-)
MARARVLYTVAFFFFFSSRRRHTRCREVSWARRCVQETGYQRRVHGIASSIKQVISTIPRTKFPSNSRYTTNLSHRFSVPRNESFVINQAQNFRRGSFIRKQEKESL